MVAVFHYCKWDPVGCMLLLEHLKQIMKHGWNIVRFLRSLCYLFKDCPTRRADSYRLQVAKSLGRNFALFAGWNTLTVLYEQFLSFLIYNNILTNH